jgi:hypothetical protein
MFFKGYGSIGKVYIFMTSKSSDAVKEI